MSRLTLVSWKTNRLRVVRADKRVTQEALAKRIGISQAKYSELERAVRVPTSLELERMARVLRVPVTDIWSEAVAS